MTCEKCGSKTNPGDQVCMNCGAELSLNNLVVPNVDLTISMEKEKEQNKQNKFWIYCTIGVVVLILLVVIIVILLMGR